MWVLPVGLDAPLLTLARGLDRCGGAVALHYDEIDDHIDALIALLSTTGPHSRHGEPHPSVDPPVTVGDQRSRVPWLDAVQYGDELDVMVGDTAPWPWPWPRPSMGLIPKLPSWSKMRWPGWWRRGWWPAPAARTSDAETWALGPRR